MERFYTYDPKTKRLTVEPKCVSIDGKTVINPTAEQYARLNPPAYPLGSSTPPEPLEGKIAMPDGYEPVDTPDGKEWRQKWRYDDAPAPTLADYDAAMEAHLRTEREARGYTTREPDAYTNSSVPRWKQDADDWAAHRDAVMLYALTLMNEVEAGTRPPPTMEEFKAGLPQIVWTYAE